MLVEFSFGPFLGPFGSKFHLSISKVKLVIRNCVIRVGSSSRSLGGCPPAPAKLRFHFLNFFGVKWGKVESGIPDDGAPSKFSELPPSKVFSLKGLWGVYVAMGSVIQNSTFPLFLFSSLCSQLNATCRKYAPRTSHREPIGKFPIGYRVIPYWIHYRL